MKTAIYVRNSTTEDKQNPQTQLMPLEKFCKDKGWEYIIFQEFASGAKESRPQLDKMLQRIRGEEFKRVLVWKLDRLGRSLQHLLLLMQEFKKRNIEFVSMTEGFDTSTAQGQLFFSIVGAFAQFERELIRERINAGLDRAKKEGKHLGRPPGSKDKKVRKKGGYYLRYMEKRKKEDEKKGIYKSMADYEPK